MTILSGLASILRHVLPQIAYMMPGNSLSWIDGDGGNLPGLLYVATDSGGATYRNLTSLSFPLAVPSTIDERVILPVTNRTLARAFYSPDYRTPYVQTFTMGITRSLPANLILNVRYIGNRGVQLHSRLNHNQPDFMNIVDIKYPITKPFVEELFAALKAKKSRNDLGASRQVRCMPLQFF